MRATSLNHVSIHAYDLGESVRFYTEIFGMQRIPEPTSAIRWSGSGSGSSSSTCSSGTPPRPSSTTSG